MPRRPLTLPQKQAAGRLRALWEAKKRDLGLTQEAVAFDFGFKQQSAVSQYLNALIPLNVSALLKFADKLEVSPEDIYPELAARHALERGGRGPTERAPRSSEVSAGPPISRRVPLISWVQAGNWNDAADPYSVGDAEDWLPCPTSCGPRTYCLRVTGPSMYNPSGEVSYREGELIFVDPDVQPISGDDVIVRLEDEGKTTFKQYIEQEGERFLKARNPSWPNPIIPVNSSATFCGVVIAQINIRKRAR